MAENRIQWIKGLEANLPAVGLAGVLYFTTDKGNLYLGTGAGMLQIGKDYTDGEVKKLADLFAAHKQEATEQFTAVNAAIAEETGRAQGIEGGLRTDLDAVIARVNTFLDGTGAAEDVIDTLQDLIDFINTHDDVEIANILAAIQALENKLAGIDTTVVAYVTAIKDALEAKINLMYTNEEIDTKLEEIRKQMAEDVKAAADANDALKAEINGTIAGLAGDVYTKAEIDAFLAWGSFDD